MQFFCKGHDYKTCEVGTRYLIHIISTQPVIYIFFLHSIN